MYSFQKGVSAINLAEDYGQQDAVKLLKNSEDVSYKML